MQIQVHTIQNDQKAPITIKLDELDQYLKHEKDYYIWIDTHFKEPGYRELLNKLSLHPQVIEHALKLNIRPHLQIEPNFLFAIFYLPFINEKKCVEYEEVNFILTNNLLVTIQKEPNIRLTKILNQIRSFDFLANGPDNTMGHIINYFSTEYYSIIEFIEEEIEKLEELQINNNYNHSFIKNLKWLKQMILHLKLYVVYQRTLLEQITGRKIYFINNTTALDNANHKILDIVNSLEAIDTTLNELLQTHLSILSINMNKVMKVLTIVSTIFLPLSFLTNWYSMNFYMPEVHLKYAYLTFTIICFILTLTMIAVFKRKKWF